MPGPRKMPIELKFGGCQRCLGPGADHLALAFSYHGHDTDNHLVSFLHVGCQELAYNPQGTELAVIARTRAARGSCPALT